jgi:uncharacterized membrane protein (UPF0182 family)
MRAPDDMPRRRFRGTGVPGRGRVILLVAAAVLFVLLMSLRGLARFYTDYLWFDSLGLSQVWSGILGTKWALGVAFTLVFAVMCFASLTVADRIAPKFRPAGPEDDLLTRYHQVVDRRAGWVRLGVSLFFGVIAGAGVSAQWNQWILFRNGGDFGVRDRTFDTDIGFYVFKLPFITTVIDWFFASLVIILLITAVAHYLNGGIRMQAPFQRVTPQVKAHLSVLLALLALVKAVDYWFGRYELTYSTRGVVDGATYTEVKAQLPATYLLLLISLLSCALFIVNIWRRGWVLPVVAVGLWGFVQIIAGAAYPTFIQRVVVEPQESDREQAYIEHNIEATRQALGLENVETEPFSYSADRDVGKRAAELNRETIRNIRLLDPKVVAPTYQNLQSLRTFYQFNDLDVDRYQIRRSDGTFTTTQVVLANRDLNVSGIPQPSWEGRHIAYTHGYGLAMAAANATTESGSPDFIVKDVPTRINTDEIQLDINQPQIYFGERLSGYSIVGTTRDEVDYLAEDGTLVTNPYTGRGGVSLDSPIRRAAFFLRFNFEWNLLLSDFVTSDSRILYLRDVRERVQEVAPFLQFDADPYPVVMGGHIVYLIDAYTTTDRYPNAQRADASGLPRGSGLEGHRFNYVRNSVKAVVDAYDGTVKLYVVDPEDPIIKAYDKAFPDLFEPVDAMPSELRDHWRYPEDLFRVQTNMWGQYHITDPRSFYDKTNGWAVAQDPGTAVATGTPAQNQPAVTTPTGQFARTLAPRIEPYYLLMRLPGEQQESFLMLRPFVPYSEDDSKRQLTAFMVGKSDPDDYGKLVVYEMPSGQLPDGPAVVNARIQADTEVSRQISLLDQKGSTVTYGDLLLIPIDNTILYVRPLYVSSQGSTEVRELKAVIAVYGSQVVMRPTLREALVDLLGIEAETFERQVGVELTPGGQGEPAPPGGGTTTTTTPGASPPAGEPGDVAALLADAERLFREADDALRSGGASGLATYQEKVTQAAEKVRQAQQQLGATTTTTTSTTQPQAEA